MYIDLNQLEALEDAGQRESFEQQRLKLNALPQVDYEAVNQYKLKYLHLLFQQMGETLLESLVSASSLKRTNTGWFLTLFSVI